MSYYRSPTPVSINMNDADRIHALEALVRDQRDYIALLESSIKDTQACVEGFRRSNVKFRRLVEGLESSYESATL